MPPTNHQPLALWVLLIEAIPPHANTALILEQLAHNPLQQGTALQHAVGRDETAGATIWCGVADGRAELQIGID
jgi:hypothetical protein